VSDDSASLEGTLERIVFQNPETQWTVARLSIEAGGEVTVVGSLLGVRTGTPLRLHGAWVNDSRYGRQFKVASYQTKSPETRKGIERFLGSGFIPGIGPELAKRLVNKFGLDTLEVIGKHPDKLRTVEGIGPSRAQSIAAAWVEQKQLQDVMVFLRGHDVPAAYAVRIFKRYGNDTISVVRQNPYRLALDIWGIGFLTADRIARSLGIEPTAPERIEAGLVHVLGQLTDNGHVHVPKPELLQQATELLAVSRDLLEEPLRKLAIGERVVCETLGDRGLCVSLTTMWQAETEAATALAQLLKTPMTPLRIDLNDAMIWFESVSGLALAPQQRGAIEAAAKDKCVVITGGPGVGKTTIVRGVVRIFHEAHKLVALAAPTGRAAKRLSESTGSSALTLHRLLEFQPQSGQFARNAELPLDADVVIVDEASMIDISLFHALVVALTPRAQLILVGDIDQLPSVGPGCVLDDVIASGAAAVVRLTEIFRQAASSAIVVNAHRVNSGRAPDIDTNKQNVDSDFYFIGREDPVAARDTLLELVAKRIPNKFGFDPFTQIQVLTPMHRGDLGTITLNHALQQVLNPPRDAAAELRRGDRAYRAGDKVMQIKNNYDKDVFNGDIGVISRVRTRTGDDGDQLDVELLDGRVVSYEKDDLDQLAHAYAVSVHKSQGSEYPAVVLPLVTQHYMMLQRNLLYTAITRGKQLVVLLGSRRAVNLAVRNNSNRGRYTWLAERIRELSEV